jgi:RimJ/RimL family protein N-acetyltransferase
MDTGDPIAEGIRLRPLAVDDAAVLASWSRNDEFCRAADWSVGLPTSEHETFHRRIVEQPPDDLIRLGLEWQARLVGYVDLHGDEPERRELGFLVGPDFWGRGLGTAGARAALDVAFTRLDLREVWAEAADANTRSIRILQRLGMRETGRGEDTIYLGQPTFYRRFAIGPGPSVLRKPVARPGHGGRSALAPA